MKPLKVLSFVGFNALWGKHLPVNVLDLEDGPSMGGGEEAALRTAVGLRELGHEVDLFWYGQPGVWKGVEFFSLADPLYPKIVGEKWDTILSWSAIRPLEYARPGVRRIFCQQLNDMHLLGDFSAIDCVVSPSLEHAKQLRGWGWDGRQAVVHNGVNLEAYSECPKCHRVLFGEVCILSCGYRGPPNHGIPWDERPYDVGYWSSPDRGLHHLLRAWPHVIANEPRARLHVFYEVKRYLDMIRVLPASYYGERGQTVGQLVLDRMHDSTVTFHGQVPRKKLAKIQKQCRVHCYPYDPLGWTEGFATSVAQGLAAGCLVMSMPMDALPSLYGDGIYWMRELDFMDRDYPRLLAQRIVQGLHGDLPNQDTIRKRGTQIGLGYTWTAAALMMERACHGEWLPADWRKAA